MQFVKQGFIDTFEGLACPADPFVAVPDGAGAAINAKTYDLHSAGVIEGRPIPAATGLTSADGPAGREAGHTYFSYSMQAGSPDPMSRVGPKMRNTLPLFGERNPWCSTIVPEIRGNAGVRDQSTTGNPWNHNRAGASIAMRDGTTTFLADASRVELPPCAWKGAPSGFAYMYRDGPLEAAPPRTGGGCHSVPEGTATTKNVTSWLTD